MSGAASGVMAPETPAAERLREARFGVAIGAALALGWCALAIVPGAIRARGKGDAPVAAGAPAPGAPTARRIDLNLASEAELQLLPGVGPAIARRIVEDRRVNGPYRSLADADRVRGVGPRTIEGWTGRATAGGSDDAAADSDER